MTLIIILILAGISLSGLIGGKGLFKRTEDASSKYNETKAREVLETVLLTDGQFEKNTNPKYNQDDFLDELIKKEIPGSDIKGDVAIIGDYAYDLDRSVPKIGKYLGLAKDLVWPEVIIVSEPTLIENGRKAKFKIRATIDEKATKGITRIELWLNGKKLNQDREYANEQREVEEEYIVNRNGVYTIKAYAELMGSNKTTIEGIVPAIKFSPNGSTEWKKQHTTEIIVEETAETITEMKYVWTDSEDEPTEFTGNCLSNRIVTGGDDTMTGTYYLWVMFKTSTGKINICGSNGFKFDNEAPTITVTTKPVTETSFKLIATSSEKHSGIAKYDFYIDGVKVASQTTTEETATCTWNGTEMSEKECFVIVEDKAKNTNKDVIIAKTMFHTWETYNIIEETKYKEKITNEIKEYTWLTSQGAYGVSGYRSIRFNETTGEHSCYNQYSGDVFLGSNTTRSPIGKYVQDRNNVIYFISLNDETIVNSKHFTKWNVRYYSSETYINTKIGSIRNIIVTSKDKEEYPKDNYIDKIWYKYIGIK